MREAVIIPARYHSSRMPGKCMADIAGRPALAWAIDIAREDDPNRRVIVLSEDGATHRMAERMGCETVQEPLSLAKSDIYETEMARYVCESIIDPPDSIAIVYGNSVVGVPGLIGRCLEAIREGYDYAQSVCRVPTMFHPWRVVDACLGELLPGCASEWSQDYPDYYVISSAGMAFRRDVLAQVNGGPLIGSRLRCKAIPHEPLPVGDLDTPTDVEAARGVLCTT